MKRKTKPGDVVPTRAMPDANSDNSPVESLPPVGRNSGPTDATRAQPGYTKEESAGGVMVEGTRGESPAKGESGDWSLPPTTVDPLPDIAAINLDEEEARVAGRYTILEKLGAGATSTVYEVRDEETGEHRALKLLDLDTEVETERFRREQELLRKLDHPNLVSVTDAGEWQGRHFMVMTLLKGGSLLDWLRDTGGKMEYVRACQLFAGAAEALHQAHLAGVVHRDIKPGNLAIEQINDLDERMLVLDFGIAKSLHGTSSLTDAGMVMGSPAYMCPERLFSGAKAHMAWDTYSLGVVMYEVITGVPLFRGKTWMETMQLIQKYTPPFISTIREDAPPALDWLVSEMLMKEPQQRPSGCDVVARRLQRIERQLM